MKVIDTREFLRFVLVGLTATVGNIIIAALARRSTSYENALFAGVCTGMAISFVLTKRFAFRSNSWARAPGELARFLLVYACSAGAYWVTAMQTKTVCVRYMRPSVAELMSILLACGVMAVISYLGHRFFTYRRRSINA